MIAASITIEECRLITRAGLQNTFAREPTEDDPGGASSRGWKSDELPERIDGEFFPNEASIFKALELISPGCVKYVILGQDPYFASNNPGTPEEVPAAIGVAFGINNGYHPIPKSLVRIKKHIYRDGIGPSDLTEWAKGKGVLLLNAALTVPKPDVGRKGRRYAGRHLKYWSAFTCSVLKQVVETNPNAIMIAWGCPARDILIKVLGEDSPSLIWSHHPMASVHGANSFAQSWAKFPDLKLS